MTHYVNGGFAGLESFQALCLRRVLVSAGVFVIDDVDCPECVRRHGEMAAKVEGGCKHGPTGCEHYGLLKFKESEQ